MSKYKYCDHGHVCYDQVRLLPTSGGELHGNVIVCHEHYLHELRYRRERQQEVTPEFNPFPKWKELTVYKPE